MGRAGRIPSRLVCETNLPEGRDRKIPTDLNQKTKTKNHCVLGTKLRLEQGRPRHFGKITICPTKDRDIINNPFNYTEILEKERAPSPMRRPTGLATRIILSNAWQDPEVPARSATIKPTEAIWQNSSR